MSRSRKLFCVCLLALVASAVGGIAGKYYAGTLPRLYRAVAVLQSGFYPDEGRELQGQSGGNIEELLLSKVRGDIFSEAFLRRLLSSLNRSVSMTPGELKQVIELRRYRKTNLVEIGVLDRDPESGMDLANRIVREYVSFARDKYMARRSKRVQAMRAEKEGYLSEVQRLETQLAEAVAKGDRGKENLLNDKLLVTRRLIKTGLSQETAMGEARVVNRVVSEAKRSPEVAYPREVLIVVFGAVGGWFVGFVAGVTGFVLLRRFYRE